jgi:hypothetical protein
MLSQMTGFHLSGWVVFHYVCVPYSFYPFISWKTLQPFSFLGPAGQGPIILAHLAASHSIGSSYAHLFACMCARVCLCLHFCLCVCVRVSLWQWIHILWLSHLLTLYDSNRWHQPSGFIGNKGIYGHVQLMTMCEVGAAVILKEQVKKQERPWETTWSVQNDTPGAREGPGLNSALSAWSWGALCTHSTQIRWSGVDKLAELSRCAHADGGGNSRQQSLGRSCVRKSFK